MDDGLDSNWVEFVENVLPNLGIDPDDEAAVNQAFDEWMHDEDFYLL